MIRCKRLDKGLFHNTHHASVARLHLQSLCCVLNRLATTYGLGQNYTNLHTSANVKFFYAPYICLCLSFNLDVREVHLTVMCQLEIIEQTIVHFFKSSSFTLPFFPICLVLFLPISAILGTPSCSLSSNIFNLLFKNANSVKCRVQTNSSLNTYLSSLLFLYWMSPKIIDHICHLPHFARVSWQQTQKIHAYDDFDDDKAIIKFHQANPNLPENKCTKVRIKDSCPPK